MLQKQPCGRGCDRAHAFQSHPVERNVHEHAHDDHNGHRHDAMQTVKSEEQREAPHGRVCVHDDVPEEVQHEVALHDTAPSTLDTRPPQ